MNLISLEENIRRFLEKHPEYQSEVAELYSLAVDEIDSGGSESLECELCWCDILELLNEG